MEEVISPTVGIELPLVVSVLVVVVLVVVFSLLMFSLSLFSLALSSLSLFEVILPQLALNCLNSPAPPTRMLGVLAFVLPSVNNFVKAKRCLQLIFVS